MQSPTISTRVSHQLLVQASDAWVQANARADLDDPAAGIARARALRTRLDAVTSALARAAPRAPRECAGDDRNETPRAEPAEPGDDRNETPRAEPAEPGSRLANVAGVPDLTAVATAYRVELRTHTIRRDPALCVAGPRIQLTRPLHVYALARAIFAELDDDQEHFVIVLRSASCDVLGFKVLASGGQMDVDVDPALVFRNALLLGAHDIIAIHNHPSGDLTPSWLDLTLTRRLVLAGQLMNVPLRDHLIYTDHGAVSIHAQHPALFMPDAAPQWDRLDAP